MKRSTEILTAFGLLTTYIAFSIWLLGLAVVQNDYDAMGINLLWPLIYLPLVYLFNRFLAWRGINLSVYAVIELAFAVGAGLLFSKCIYFQPARTGAVVFHSIFYAFGTACAAFAGFEPVKAKTLSLCFDLHIIMMFIILLLSNYTGILITGEVIASCCIALAITLIALLAARVDAEGSLSAVSGSPSAGRLMVIIGIALVALAVALIAFFALGGVQELSQGLVGIGKSIFGALKAAAIWLWEGFDRFIHWLAEMFPVDEASAPAEIMPSIGEGSADVSMDDVSLPVGAYIAAITASLAVVAGLIFSMRKINLRASASVRRSAVRVRRKSGLADALKKLFKRLLTAFGYKLNCVRHSKTAPGLLAYCEKRAGKENRRFPGESGEKYLLRLAKVGYSSELSMALSSLSVYVERSFYSREDAVVPDELRTAIRRGKFRAVQT